MWNNHSARCQSTPLRGRIPLQSDLGKVDRLVVLCSSHPVMKSGKDVAINVVCDIPHLLLGVAMLFAQKVA